MTSFVLSLDLHEWNEQQGPATVDYGSVNQTWLQHGSQFRARQVWGVFLVLQMPPFPTESNPQSQSMAQEIIKGPFSFSPLTMVAFTPALSLIMIYCRVIAEGMYPM